MKRYPRFFPALLGVVAVSWIPARQDQSPILERYDLSEDAGVRVELPSALAEISGLASTPDGRLFAHDDERAVVYELDSGSGEVLKRFSVGTLATPGDFEGIAIAGERFFLTTSEGTLLEFREGGNNRAVRYRIHDPGIRGRCEMEGLAFDELENELLMPCKTPRTKDLEDHLVVFSVPLSTLEVDPEPRFFVPLEELDSKGLGKNFHPSSIEIHPDTRSVLLIAAREEAMAELGPGGDVLATKELKRKAHPQPEGVTFLPDGRLVMADEGQGERGTLTWYRLKPQESVED